MSIELPGLIYFEDFAGDWDSFINFIYEIFKNDLIDNPPQIEKPFRLKKYPIFDGKESAFWHLVSEGQVEDNRTPNIRRCERISWIKPLIEKKESKYLRVWRNQRKTKKGIEKRIVISKADFDYVVILTKRKNYYMLCTAYPVERSHQRRKLAKEYNAYKKTGDTF